MEKNYIGASSFLLDSFRLAKKIYNSGYVPDKIIGLWRGASLATLAIDEYFRFKGVKIRAYPLKVEAYSGDKLNKDTIVFGLNDLYEQIKNANKILIVDDIFDTGSSLQKVFDELNKKFKDIKIAAVYFKPNNNKTALKPDFYMHETESWIVFPHELEGLTLEELAIKDIEVYNILTT